MEDDLHFLKIEDDLIVFLNGRQYKTRDTRWRDLNSLSMSVKAIHNNHNISTSSDPGSV